MEKEVEKNRSACVQVNLIHSYSLLSVGWSGISSVSSRQWAVGSEQWAASSEQRAASSG